MSKTKYLYRIKKINEEKYSSGGELPKFTKQGKFWSLENLKKHLSLVSSNNTIIRYSNCRIKKYRLIEEDADDFNFELQQKILEVI